MSVLRYYLVRDLFCLLDDDSRHEFIITFSQMQADMRDVAFYYSKKSGAIKLKDSGLADVVIGGEGVNVTIHLVASTNDPRSFFQVKKVNVKIDTLKFAIRDAKHDLLYKTLRPLVRAISLVHVDSSTHLCTRPLG